MLKRRRAYLNRVVRMNALRRGLLGGHPVWRAIWVGMQLRRFWGRVSKKGEAPVTFSESIGEGESWALVHVPEDSRRGRGEGRRFLLGPRRRGPAFAAIWPAALVAGARRLFEAPDAARVNEILGVNAVEDEPKSRAAARREARADKRQQRANRRAVGSANAEVPDAGPVSEPGA